MNQSGGKQVFITHKSIQKTYIRTIDIEFLADE